MHDIRTTGDMREFLGEILVGIREGKVDTDRANSIAKIAQQINTSLSTEVNAAIQLKQLGEGNLLAGSMLLTRSAPTEAPRLKEADQDGMIWCDQCDMRVTAEQATGCKSKHCKAKEQ